MGIGFTLTFGQITYGTMISSQASVTQSSGSTQSVLKEPTVSAQGAVLMDAATGVVRKEPGSAVLSGEHHEGHDGIACA